MVTQLDLEAGVKGEIPHLQKLHSYDSLWVVFTFRSSRTNNKGDIRPF